MMPCPGCQKTGQFAQVHVDDAEHRGFRRPMARVECMCGVCGPWAFTVDDAWMRWGAMSGILAARSSPPQPSAHPDKHALFHRLWTKAVGTSGYDKEEWKQLERVLFDSLSRLDERAELEKFMHEALAKVGSVRAFLQAIRTGLALLERQYRDPEAVRKAVYALLQRLEQADAKCCELLPGSEPMHGFPKEGRF